MTASPNAWLARAEPMTESEARQQIQDEKEFYGHLASYLAVNSLLAVVSLTSGGLWFLFPLLGWGAGLASHAARVFGLPGKGKEWEARRLRTLLGQDETQARLDALRDEVQRLERGAQPPAGLTETDRLRRRIEHLEAIVTSRDWDLLDEAFGAPGSESVPGAEGDAARIARRVR